MNLQIKVTKMWKLKMTIIPLGIVYDKEGNRK